MKTSAGPVTAEERQQAQRQDRDRVRIEQIAARQAALIGFRAQRAAIKAFRNRNHPGFYAKQEILRMAPLVVEAMVAGHLAGLRRAVLDAPVKLALRNPDPGVLTEGIKKMAQRLGMTESELQNLYRLYGTEALKVVQHAADAVDRRIQAQLIALLHKGAHVREGTEALRQAFAAAGLTPNNPFTLEAIFRTQTQLAFNAGSWQADQRPEIQEILWGYKYATVHDDRVRPEHVGFDGVTLPKEDPFWVKHWPPNGFACRCKALKIFRSRKSVGVPAAVEVDGKMVKPSVDDGFAFNPGMLLGFGK